MTNPFPLLAHLSAAILVAGLLAGCKSSGCGCPAPGPAAGHSVPSAPPALPSYSTPAPIPTSAGPAAAAATKYGGQKTCPVTGDTLGSMGEPIPVSVKGETVYVCCKGCVRRVQADPDKYLAVVRAERAGR